MKHVAIDFDGVIHGNTSKWTSAIEIHDPPISGAFEAIEDYTLANFIISIFSTRNIEPGAIQAMRDWFARYGLPDTTIARLQFPTSKPTYASLFIDDCGYQFQGTFPSVEYVKEFKPWYK